MKIKVNVARLIKDGKFPWHLTPFKDRPSTYTPRFPTLCRMVSRYVNDVDVKRLLDGGGTVGGIRNAVAGKPIPIVDMMVNNPRYYDDRGHFDPMSEFNYLAWMMAYTPFENDMSDLFTALHVSGKFVFPADYVEYVEDRQEGEDHHPVAYN